MYGTTSSLRVRLPLTPVLVLLCCLLGAAPAMAAEPPRMLWVDSYHEGFEWSDGIGRGIMSVLNGSGVELEIVRMDTRRNPDPDFCLQAGKLAHAVFERYRPQVVIASDDNAQLCFVVPYLRDTQTPVVFCGVNWEAGMYGYPAPNVTGMIEVNLVPELLRHLQRHASGERIGYLSGDVETERKTFEIYNQRFFAGSLQNYLVRDFDAFRQAFLRAQEQLDMLLIGNYSGIPGWNHDEARAFIQAHGRIPTGSFDAYMAPFAVYTLGKSPEEQGEWAAQTALRILAGVAPGETPLVENSRVELVVNLALARAMNLVIPVAVLRTAQILDQPPTEP